MVFSSLTSEPVPLFLEPELAAQHARHRGGTKASTEAPRWQTSLTTEEER